MHVDRNKVDLEIYREKNNDIELERGEKGARQADNGEEQMTNEQM